MQEGEYDLNFNLGYKEAEVTTDRIYGVKKDTEQGQAFLDGYFQYFQDNEDYDIPE